MRLTFEEGTLLLRDYEGDEAPPAFGLGRARRSSFAHKPISTAKAWTISNAKEEPLSIQLRANIPSR